MSRDIGPDGSWRSQKRAAAAIHRQRDGPVDAAGPGRANQVLDIAASVSSSRLRSRRRARPIDAAPRAPLTAGSSVKPGVHALIRWNDRCCQCPVCEVLIEIP
jgi:hypothetical protein